MIVNTLAKAAGASVLLAVLASAPALAHHKAGHTANCHVHTVSPYCVGVGEVEESENTDPGVSAVPVPASVLMLGTAFGLAGAYAAYRRRKVQK